MIQFIVEDSNPSAYMNNFRIIRNHENYLSTRTLTYCVISDSDRFGKDAIVYESFKLEDCAKWICDTCEFFMEIFADSPEYDEAKQAYEEYSKRPINVTGKINLSDLDKLADNIKIAITKITSIMNIDLNVDMFTVDDETANALAGRGRSFYWRNEIVLCTNASIKTVIHEIGHYIHDYYFANSQYKWNKVDRTKYSFTNKYEAFAEIFVQFIYNPESDSPNILKMKKLFDDLHLLKY